MGEDPRRNEPFIEDAHRFPPDERRKRHPPSSEQESRRRRAQQRKRRNSVFRYIAILFVAAFALLAYTFMMERRQSKQQIDDLKQSASAVQTLQGLMTDNDRLKEQSKQLEEQIKELERQLDAAQSEKANAETQNQDQEKTIEAMHWFWQLNDAYVRGRTKQSRELITAMEASGLQEALPKENITGTDRFSPYDRYMEIRGKIIK